MLPSELVESLIGTVLSARSGEDLAIVRDAFQHPGEQDPESPAGPSATLRLLIDDLSANEPFQWILSADEVVAAAETIEGPRSLLELRAALVGLYIDQSGVLVRDAISSASDGGADNPADSGAAYDSGADNPADSGAAYDGGADGGATSSAYDGGATSSGADGYNIVPPGPGDPDLDY